VKIDLAPTDIASIVTVDQALRSQGLPALGGEDGSLTITEFKAKRAAVIAKAAAADSGTDKAATPSSGGAKQEPDAPSSADEEK
jgi:hypothetical protein